jgi:hypothetical protein
MHNVIKKAFIAAALVAAGPASADTFYCGTHLIEEGMTRDEVTKYCGEPDSKSIQNWVYDRGPEKFDVTVHFLDNGTVSRIQEMTEPD